MTSESPEKNDAEAAGGFMSRWSRRKHQEEQHSVDVTSTIEPTSAEQNALFDANSGDSTPGVRPEVRELDAAPDSGDDSEEELLTDEDMPAIETITSDGDVSMFFNRGVSRELRKAALKHLFSLPALNITDGLNDYDEDYTSFEPLGDIVTSDMRFHAERKARLAEEEEARKLAEAEAEVTEETKAQDSQSEEVEVEVEQVADNDATEENTEVENPAESLSNNAETEEEIDPPLQDRTTV